MVAMADSYSELYTYFLMCPVQLSVVIEIAPA